MQRVSSYVAEFAQTSLVPWAEHLPEPLQGLSQRTWSALATTHSAFSLQHIPCMKPGIVGTQTSKASHSNKILT